jgi:hypothetical protein
MRAAGRLGQQRGLAAALAGHDGVCLVSHAGLLTNPRWVTRTIDIRQFAAPPGIA